MNIYLNMCGAFVERRCEIGDFEVALASVILEDAEPSLASKKKRVPAMFVVNKEHHS